VPNKIQTSYKVVKNEVEGKVRKQGSLKLLRNMHDKMRGV
jgi:hypothetical protein